MFKASWKIKLQVKTCSLFTHYSFGLIISSNTSDPFVCIETKELIPIILPTNFQQARANSLLVLGLKLLRGRDERRVCS